MVRLWCVIATVKYAQIEGSPPKIQRCPHQILGSLPQLKGCGSINYPQWMDSDFGNYCAQLFLVSQSMSGQWVTDWVDVHLSCWHCSHIWLSMCSTAGVIYQKGYTWYTMVAETVVTETLAQRPFLRNHKT